MFSVNHQFLYKRKQDICLSIQSPYQNAVNRSLPRLTLTLNNALPEHSILPILTLLLLPPRRNLHPPLRLAPQLLQHLPLLRIPHTLEEPIRPRKIIQLLLHPKAIALRPSNQRTNQILPRLIQLLLHIMDDLDMPLELALVRECRRADLFEQLEVPLVLLDLEFVGDAAVPKGREEFVFLGGEAVFFLGNASVQVVELAVDGLEELEEGVGTDEFLCDVLFQCGEEIVEGALHGSFVALLRGVPDDVVDDAAEGGGVAVLFESTNFVQAAVDIAYDGVEHSEPGSLDGLEFAFGPFHGDEDAGTVNFGWICEGSMVPTSPCLRPHS